MGLPLLCSWGFTFCSPSCSYLTGFIKNKLYYLFVSSVFLLMTQPESVQFPTPLLQSCYAQLLFLLPFPCCLLLCQYPTRDFPLHPPSCYATIFPLYSSCVYTITQHTIYNPRVGCIGGACRTCSCAGDFVNEMNTLLEMIPSNVLHR